MHSKRSYLDSVNAGRQRRPQATIDELNQRLAELGARLERPEARPPYRPDERVAQDRDLGRPLHKDDYLDRDLRQRMSGAGRDFAGSASQDLARSVESARRQDEGLSAIGRIAGELKGLRDEMRQQIGTNLNREFESLRADIERAYDTVASNAPSPELGRKLERLSDSIQGLASRSDDKAIELLRREMDQVRQVMNSLAREETVRSVERRWSALDQRFDAFEEKLQGRGSAGDPAIEALTERLEQIAHSVNTLPESLSLRSLEEKVRTLAGAVDHFSRRQEAVTPAAFAMIEERLDEISRAIVATAVSSQPEPISVDHLERVEARIASLARQIEELADDRPTGQVIDRINALSQRVDDLARRADFPEQAVARLSDQIALISERLEAGFAAPDAEPIVRGLEQRFSSLSDLLQKQQGDAAKRGQTIFRDLESRLDDLAARLELPPQDNSSSMAIMGAIDARFDELSSRLGGAAPDGARLSHLETRLEDISERLDRSAQTTALDPSLIESLQAQVAALSDHLSQPGRAPAGDDLAPRLDSIEKAILDNREAVLDAARKAAEETIRRMGGVNSDDPGVAELAGDLRALDALTRRSDERNARTFEAIHDTLLKIVDRLGTLEGREPAQAPAAAAPEPRRTVPSDRMPALDSDPFEADIRPGKRSPAEAAAAAASAALSDPLAPADAAVDPEATPGKLSLLGGLARALTTRRANGGEPVLAGATAVAEPVVPILDLDEPLDPKIANTPLEPGSGAPDLSAIVKRVRDERGLQLKSKDVDTAKSDFIAAARRAAQAAAAEAETSKVRLDKVATATKSGLGGIFKKHRKASLMAVGGVVLILAGLQLGRAFLDEGSSVAATSTPEELEMEAADVAAADLPDAGFEATATEAPPARSVDNAPALASEPTGAVATALLPPEEDMAEDLSAMPAAPASTAPEMETASAAPATPAPASITVPADAGPIALREAAEQGDPKALFEIGARYHEGRGTAANPQAAAKWYEMAAEAGFAPAQYRIGNFYEKGTGVERDIKKAKTWYHMAAEQGNASAMHNLAVLHAMGADGTTDNESAGRWFVKAAELGVKDSQFNLGILAAKGVGVPQSLEDSYKWFALVAQGGDKDAASKRDEVANALRPEQLTKARAAVELWKPQPLVEEANDVTVPEAWTESNARTASVDQTGSVEKPAGVDMKQAVRNIQLILSKNGYDPGGADGVMGAKTKTAIAGFQKDNGMQPTGEVDEQLIHALLQKK